MIVARHLMVWALLAWAPAAWAQQGGDLQAQILYAYQTEDTNSLANLIQDLTARLRDALNLAPRNPRAVFLSSTYGLAYAKPGTAERQRAFAQLQLAVQLFDA